MRVGIFAGGHLANIGGGLQAVLWHVRALKSLGHEILVFVSVKPHQKVLDEWARGLNIAWYQRGVEKDFDAFLSISHFDYAQPLAKMNFMHLFFPMEHMPEPPAGFKLYSNSQYSANAVKAKWGRDCTPMYIPIDASYHSGVKEPIILHVSRFAEPNGWADKGHRQMIQAIRRIRYQLLGWRFIMAGAVEERQDGYFSELLQTAQGLPIEFMPNLSQPEIVDLFSKASIYWHATGMALANIPSAQEHLGLAPIEASASGAVPICYNSGGIPEVVQNGGTGVLFDDPRELGDLTVRLIGDMRLWSGLHQQGMWWGKGWQDFEAFKLRIQAMLDDQPIPVLPSYKPTMKYGQSDTTAVIPTFNSPEVLKKCLDSLKVTAPEMNILIINNGDPLPELELDISNQVKIVDAGSNLGFAGAHKLASTMIDTPLALMLNDDVECPYRGWLEFMLLVMDNPTVGIVGSKLLFPNGKIQHCGGSIDFNRPDPFHHSNYGGDDGINISEVRQVPFVTGAMMLVRKELFVIPDELLGGLNFEEVWMSNAAREKGFSTIYQPASVAIHHEGLTKKRTSDVESKVSVNQQALMKRWYSK